MNAKQEFLEHTKGKEVRCASINFGYACLYEYPECRYIALKEEFTTEDLSYFLEQLDHEYDDGFGGQQLYGNIWYTDGTWSERGEYDGSEWWESPTFPQIPENLNALSPVKAEPAKKTAYNDIELFLNSLREKLYENPVIKFEIFKTTLPDNEIVLGYVDRNEPSNLVMGPIPEPDAVYIEADTEDFAATKHWSNQEICELDNRVKDLQWRLDHYKNLYRERKKEMDHKYEDLLLTYQSLEPRLLELEKWYQGFTNPPVNVPYVYHYPANAVPAYLPTTCNAEETEIEFSITTDVNRLGELKADY